MFVITRSIIHRVVRLQLEAARQCNLHMRCVWHCNAVISLILHYDPLKPGELINEADRAIQMLLSQRSTRFFIGNWDEHLVVKVSKFDLKILAC